MDNKWVWLLGGGIMQVPMAKQIKKRNYNLLVTDIDSNCPCREFADEFAKISVYGLTDNLAFARSIKKPMAGVLTAGTDAGVEVAVIADELGLLGVDPEIARKIHSKSAMRKILQGTGLSTPKFLTGEYEDLVKSHREKWTLYPCIVKADNNSGSKGMSVVTHQSHMLEALSKAYLANRGSNNIVIEEMLIGTDIDPSFREFATSEIALDFLVEDGQAHFANGALRLFWRDLDGIEAGHFNPFIADYGLMDLAQKAVDKFGLKWGPFKLDLLLDQRYGWCILETAARLSGGFDHMYTSPLATGKDVTGALLDMALGLPLDKNKLITQWSEVACCLAPRLEPGPIQGWQGDTLFTYPLAKHEIKELRSNGDRPLFIIRSEDSRAGALQRAKEVKISPIRE